MTHYYLNVINGTGFVGDQEGEDFRDLDEARAKAAESVRSILSDEVKTEGRIDLQGRIEIADHAGMVVLTLPFREAVELRLDDTGSPEIA